MLDWIRDLVVDAVKSELFPYILGIALIYHHMMTIYIGYRLGRFFGKKKHA